MNISPRKGHAGAKKKEAPARRATEREGRRIRRRSRLVLARLSLLAASPRAAMILSHHHQPLEPFLSHLCS